MLPLIKICGLMRAQDVQMCVRHGADMVGFVVEYPRPVPWNLSAAEAGALIATVGQPTRTCVVTSGPPEHVLRIAAQTRPNTSQLHGNETLADTAYLAHELGKQGVKIIKAIFPDTPELEKTAAAFCAAGVDAVLFDPRTPHNAHHGGMADLSVYQKIQRAVRCPVILAGGINPDNAAEIVRQTSAPMIDLMSGVETSPGIKDEAKVVALFQALRGGAPT
jgi:phosphoribosylanthranilate isomerase